MLVRYFEATRASARDTRSRWLLRAANRVGRSARILGSPRVMNRGRIEIGAEFFWSSSPARSHIVADGGKVVVGDRVRISYGAAIAARAAIDIGSDVEIGPYVVILDSDYHVVGDRSVQDEPSPIRIDDGVRLGARVTVLRGAWIGAKATVLDGSVVSGRIEPGATVSGVPARASCGPRDEPSHAPSAAVWVPRLVMDVLNLRVLPAANDGPSQISQWDSLGALKIVLALEEAYGISLSEQELKSMQSISHLAAAVVAATTRRELSTGA